MAYENNDKKMESVYSKRIKAGKRRTYFFDVRETRGSDFYLTITESRKRFESDGYDRHKIFLYKEDFNKFIKGLTEAIDFVKTDLMPTPSTTIPLTKVKKEHRQNQVTVMLHQKLQPRLLNNRRIQLPSHLPPDLPVLKKWINGNPSK